MTGELIINDKDAWTTWSARLTDESFSNLETHAPMKSYAKNNARSQHGQQVFATNPRVDARTVILTFSITCQSMDDFLLKKRALENELTKGIIDLKVFPLKLGYKLLIDEDSTFTLTAGTSLRSGKLVIRFTEPNPKDRIVL